MFFFLSNIIVNIKKKMWKSYFGYKHSTGKSWILIDCKDCWFHSYLNEAKIGNNVRLWKYSNYIVLTTLFLYLAGLSKAGCLVCDDLVRSAQGGCTNRQVCQDTQVGLQIKNLMLRNVITQRRRSSKCGFFGK